MLEKILKRNLLKYSAGQSITCPKCGKIADYRKWVIWESPGGQHGAHCADCHREILAKVHDDKPNAYLVSIGWKIDTMVDFDKPPRVSAAYPQKPGKALNTFLRKDIAKGFKNHGYHAKADRFFPVSYNPGELQELTMPDGEIVIDHIGPRYNAKDTADYVRSYCQLNHLTMP